MWYSQSIPQGFFKKKEFLGRKIKTANFSISKNLICAEAANVGYYGLLVECAWLSSMIGNATYRSWSSKHWWWHIKLVNWNCPLFVSKRENWIKHHTTYIAAGELYYIEHKRLMCEKFPDLKVAIPHLWFQILMAAVTYKPRSALCR